ncbi:hypothetical protein ADIS_2754 [Lunatimonas lonarensis]|uniref:Uncharacterized protein n=1 Tax=Lunatimonas lonarensis TaxID=1232681 RepID=R7ZRU5_9BACT|nr:hypothetical protein [Lunatimonas lonarensis]EON76768.1 hypothetical protein ADIS_2754 [Lunatimonas lonarensis]
MNQPLGAECFEMDGGLLGNQWTGSPMAACGLALTQSEACPDAVREQPSNHLTLHIWEINMW